MYCYRCGAEAEDGVKFCPACGADLQEAQKSPAIQSKTLRTKGDLQPASPPVKTKVKTEKKPRVYVKSSAKTRTLSVLLCVLLVLTGFVSLTIFSLRLGLSEDNVRSAYRQGKLSEAVINTTSGDKDLVDILMEHTVEADTGELIEQDRNTVESILDKTYVNNFIENSLVDYSNFMLSGDTPQNLNAKACCGFLETLSFDLNHMIGYSFSNEEINNIRQRIENGNLSYLNIEKKSAGFKKQYGFEPGLIPILLSVWMMIAFVIVSAVSIGLIAYLGRKNLPAVLCTVGKGLIIIGGIGLILSLTVLILALTKSYFFISEFVKGLALYEGITSIAVLIPGVCMLLLRSVLMKNATVLTNESTSDQ